MAGPAHLTSEREGLFLERSVRALRPPWSIPVDAKVVNGIPTLVLIGDDVGMYSEVAEVRKGEGATVHVLAGAAHRPHDGDDATGLMVAHWARVEAQP